MSKAAGDAAARDAASMTAAGAGKYIVDSQQAPTVQAQSCSV